MKYKMEDFIFFNEEKGFKNAMKKILDLLNYLDEFKSDPYITLAKDKIVEIILDDLTDIVFLKDAWDEHVVDSVKYIMEDHPEIAESAKAEEEWTTTKLYNEMTKWEEENDT